VSRCIVVGAHSNGVAQSGEILRTEDAGSIWRSVYVLSQANTQLNAVSCPTAQVCVAAGNSLTQSIVRTADGGTGWARQRPAVPLAQRFFLTVACMSPLVCHAGGSAAPVGTVDGGVTWSAASLPPTVVKITGITCPSTTACVGVALGEGSAPATIKLSS